MNLQFFNDEPIQSNQPGDLGDVWIQLIPEQPVSIGDNIRNGDNVIYTMDSVPGSTIRGAVAYEMIRRGLDEKHPLFIKTFLSGDSNAIFSPLFPRLLMPDQLVTPMPFTAMKCKKAGKSGNTHNKLHDSLLTHLTSCWLHQIGCDLDAQFSCLHGNTETDICRFERAKGYLLGYDSEAVAFNPEKKLVTRVAIDKAAGRASEGNLFSIESIRPSVHTENGDSIPIVFEGQILNIDNNMIDLICRESGRFFIGRSITSGYGKSKIMIARDKKIPDLKTRIEMFNKETSERWKIIFGDGSDAPFMISVLILSPLPLTEISWQESILRLLDGKEILLKYIRSSHSGRYEMIDPESPEKLKGTCIAPGSVLLIECQRNLDLLATLESKGLCSDPMDRSVGLGRIMICHPFHVYNSFKF